MCSTTCSSEGHDKEVRLAVICTSFEVDFIDESDHESVLDTLESATS